MFLTVAVGIPGRAMLSGSFRILSAFFQHRVIQVVDAINTHVMPLAGNCPSCQGQVDPVQSSRCTRFGSVQEPDRRRADYLLDGLWFLELGSAEACMLCLFLRGSICSQVVRRLTRYFARLDAKEALGSPRSLTSSKVQLQFLQTHWNTLASSA